jgi:hypothetical protein
MGMNQAIESTGMSRTWSVAGRGLRAAGAAGRAAVLAAVAAFAGCSDEGAKAPVFPVKGAVQFEGEPASGAFVAFHPKTPAKPGEDAPRPSAQVQPDGGFEVTTYTQGDGAPAGEYAVTVLWTKPITQGKEAVPGPNVIPSIYGSPDKTPLSVTIKEGPNQLEPFAIAKNVKK